MKWKLLLVALLVLAPLSAAEDPPGPDWVPRLLSAEEAAEGFYPLFNGTDLDGWWIRGSNQKAFAAADGMLMITGEGGGDWIFTDREYENFVLRYEYKLPPEGGNSGVGIRATKEGNPAFSGMEIQVLTPGWETEWQRAGALYSTVPPAVQADNPAGEWNAVEVLCDGPRIRTIMNGQQLYDVKTTDYTEQKDWQKPLTDRAKRGHIAIQDHGGGNIAFRNIRIKPLPGGEGWERLFNGTDLTGWKVVGDATWTVLDDGILQVDGAGMTGRSELRSLHAFDNFELSLFVRPHKKEGGGGANSGVFFRGSGDAPWPRTYEAQVDNHDPRQFTGAIWDQVPASELRAMDDCWLHMHIVANGAHIQVAINGKNVVDYQSERHGQFPSGWFSLQGHDPKSIVDFRDIELKRIPAEK
ncbi:MAG: DUF1080 domain-containing protein [Candidatus Hydrogenedentes bacterium]|nr:DUF1080 domain-containing protein [Candidatus Hydrogenedentota bacterium]